MKKLSLILILSLISLAAQAQWTGKYKAGLEGGYEWNIFLNPTSVQTDSDLLRRNDLWINASYAGAFFSADFRKDIKNGRLKWGARFSGANYNATVNANRHTIRWYGSYRKKYAPRKYFEFAPEFYRVQRQGVNDNDAILTTPFSYTRITLPFKLDYYRGNRVWLKTTAGYTFKAYDQFRNRSISYHAGFVGASLSKKWIDNQVERKLTFSSNLEMRLYRDDDLIFLEEEFLAEDEEDIEPVDMTETERETRLWTYISNDLVYDIKPSRQPYELTLGVYTTLRLDRDQRNAYREWAPGISGSWQLPYMKLRGSLRYVNRKFPNRQMGEHDSPLRYQFVKAWLEAEVPLTDHMDFRVRGNVVNRNSSNTALTRAFRGYFNSMVEAGVVYRF